MKIARLLTAAAALVALTSAPALAADVQAPAGGPAAHRSELQAQAKASHLSPQQARSLQTRVDRVVAQTGGTQVAINQVRLNGGDILIPLPGEAQARELGAAPRAGFPHGCKFKQFCLYQKMNYTGMVARMSSCTLHDTSLFIFESYVNNQTRGTRARFYDDNLHLLSHTNPAPAEGTTSLGVRTFYVRPC
jgi:hypothetical protein